MKKILLLVVILFSISTFSLEPVGMSVNYNLKSNFNTNEYSDVFFFKDASFIKIHLKKICLKESDSLTISNDEESYKIVGPMNGEMWLPSLNSSFAKIFLKGGDNSKPFYEIDEVGIGFEANRDRVESICQNDDRRNAVCYSQDMQAAADPVGRMLFQEGGVWYLCTGSLISSSGHFLTNNHCISDQSGASSLEVWWRYQSSTCNGTSGSKEYTSNGSTFLTTNENLDFTLLQITDTNIQKYGFIPIANREAVKGERIWIPQHGGGNIKTFAVESDMDQGGYAIVDDASLDGNVANSDIGYYADTEGGSSGSPVLDLSNKLLAIHHFGLPYGYPCGSYMNQGVKMSLIYPKIKDYLPLPPEVSSVTKATDPFRIIVMGDKFKEGIEVYIGSSTTPWQNVSYKSKNKIVIKKGNALKQLFPKGVSVNITLVNPDGGTITTSFKR